MRDIDQMHYLEQEHQGHSHERNQLEIKGAPFNY